MDRKKIIDLVEETIKEAKKRVASIIPYEIRTIEDSIEYFYREKFEEELHSLCKDVLYDIVVQIYAQTYVNIGINIIDTKDLNELLLLKGNKYEED